MRGNTILPKPFKLCDSEYSYIIYGFWLLRTPKTACVNYKQNTATLSPHRRSRFCTPILHCLCPVTHLSRSSPHQCPPVECGRPGLPLLLRSVLTSLLHSQSFGWRQLRVVRVLVLPSVRAHMHGLVRALVCARVHVLVHVRALVPMCVCAQPQALCFHHWVVLHGAWASGEVGAEFLLVGHNRIWVIS
jgi:hypothetical protein